MKVINFTNKVYYVWKITLLIKQYTLNYIYRLNVIGIEK